MPPSRPGEGPAGGAGRGYDPTVRSAAVALWHRAAALPALLQDAWIYLASAVFAGGVALKSVSADYRGWGETAAVAYSVAAAVCFAAARASRSSAWRPAAVAALRRVLVVLVIGGAVLVPLLAQLVWRAEGVPGAHAQPEVAVVERAGDRAASAQDPYLLHPTTVGVAPSSDSHQVDDSSFFPYLPGMVPFGLVNAVRRLPAELKDARVALTGFTLLVGAIALLWSDASLARRGRALQFLVALPTGALPMVTGGDDLPVLALMLLGLVLAERRRPVLAGMVLGAAGTLKFTAWPLLVLMAPAIRDSEGRPAALRYSLAALVLLVPVLGVGIGLDPVSFFENVVRFPLGLARVKSPAASPLLGEVLTHALPQHRLALTALLLVVGAGVALAVYGRMRPRTPAAVARYVAFAMLLATVLAPATRFGYLIYPADLVVWAWLLDGMQVGGARAPSERRARRGPVPGRLAAQSASPSSTSEIDALVTALAPASEVEKDEATGWTSTSTSQ